MRLRFLFGAVATLTLGCSGGDDGGGPASTIAISGTPESGAMTEGETVLVQAITNGQVDHVDWSSSNEAVLLVTPQDGTTGHVANITAVGGGRATITASGDDQHGSVRLSVVSASVAGLTIRPDSAISIVGMKQTYVALLVDSLDRALVNHAITWSSSNPGVASVNAAGQVTGMETGTTRIIAASEGKADTATVTVMAGSTGDWSGVLEDWTTFQGTARHDGFVPATVDARVFAQRWDVEPQPSVAPSAAAFGAGLLFTTVRLSTTATPKLLALDPVDGSRRWMYDFGSTYREASPPAFSDGNVYVGATKSVDSFIWSFTATGGVERFNAQYDNYATKSGTPVIVGSSVFLTAGYSRGTYAFSIADGVRQWFVESQWNATGISPTVADGQVFVYASAFGARDGPGIAAIDAATGLEAWTIDNPGSGNLVLGSLGNLVAAESGKVVSLDLTTRSTRWEVSGSFYSVPAVGDGVVYVQNGEAIEARRESDGALLWAWKIADYVGFIRPMIATHNLLFINTGVVTYAIDMAAHLPVWWYPGGGQLSLSKDGLLIISGDDGHLTAIRIR